MSWVGWANGELDAIRLQGRWRSTVSFDASGPVGTLATRGPVTSFASNDYLGLSAHPAVIAAAHAAIDRWGTGSTASRLIVGTRPIHDELEDALAAWKRAESALVFSTGYSANLGVLATLAVPGVTVVSDELNHASIIDGCRLARAEVLVYRHNDLDHVAHHLAGCGRAIVVTDSVFSMDGDTADVTGLSELCAATGSLLVLDEAHAVLGREQPLADGTEIVRVGTLSKTLGALGGFVAGPEPIIDLLRNRARSFIFTTAPSPADTAAALAALAVVNSAEGESLRRHLRDLVDRVRPGHPSPIVPVVLGSEERALRAAALLLEQGFLVPAIRPPTVAAGTSRLRVALSAAHTVEQVDSLARALTDLPRHLETTLASLEAS